MEEKIAVFDTDVSVEEIGRLLRLQGSSPLYVAGASYEIKWCQGVDYVPSPKVMAKRVKEGGTEYLVYGRKKTVWVHKYPGNLAKLLTDNGVSFTLKFIRC